MDRGGWWATVHGVAKKSDMTEWLSMHTLPHDSLDIPFQHHRSKMFEAVVSTYAAIIIPFCAVSTMTPLVLILSEGFTELDFLKWILLSFSNTFSSPHSN